MTIPHGYCHCGCGQRTRIAPQNHTAKGWVKGEPILFFRKHESRKPRPALDGVVVPEGAALIPACGGIVVVDEGDYALVVPFAWRINDSGYAVADMPTPSGWRSVRMHRYILALTENDEVEVDHLDGNKRDNRRANLRVCTHAENMKNVRVHRDTLSGLKGAHKSGDQWESRIMVDGKRMFLGIFETPEDAHNAYVAASLKYHGDFACEG
jgi:hypothetical protein